jgi:hypothetical protein
VDEEPVVLPLVNAKKKQKNEAAPQAATKRAVLELVPDAESGTMPVPSAAIEAAKRQSERDRRDRSRVALDVDIGLHSETNFFSARDAEIASYVVDRCVRVKARVVALDERETGVRATLNLGHTIGHALESAGGYTGLTHGEAVSLGLVAALRLGERKGHTPSSLTRRVLSLLARLGLPHQLSAVDLQKSTSLLSHDKKRSGGSIRFVYARAAGDVFTESILLSDLIGVAPSLAD